jgi:protein-S-isoprenylcysteine O-methyltransferase Ste14
MAEQTRWQHIAKRIRVPLGFISAAVFLWLAHPSALALTASLLLVVPGVALRAYASGYVKKNAELTTSGPYAYTRNPLYLGSLMIAIGFGAASGSWLLLGLLTALFAAIYIPTIRGEEVYLRSHFSGFDQYVRKVPVLFPRLTPATEMGAGGAFSRALYLKHREYNAAMGAAAIYGVLLLRLAFQHRR